MENNCQLPELLLGLLSEQIEIETEIAGLKNNCCKGNLSEKVIKGRPQTYLQWYEDGKTKCRYIRKSELPELKEHLADRDRKLSLLESRLKCVREKLSALADPGSSPVSSPALSPAASSCLRDSYSPYDTAARDTASYRTVSGVFDGLNVIPEELLPLKKGTRVRIVYCPDSGPDEPMNVLERYSGILNSGKGTEIEAFVRKERKNDRSF